MRIDTWNAHRRRVSTRAGEVACVDIGEGPAALLVHGLVVNGHLWRRLVAELDGVRRCVALDLPGHGATPAPPDRDLSLPGLAGTVDALCEALGLDAVDLVGNDTGGAVCQVVAARHPERIRTLTLTNCDTHDNLPPPFFRAATERARQGRYAPALRAMAADPVAARSARGLGACLEDPDGLDAEASQRDPHRAQRVPEVDLPPALPADHPRSVEEDDAAHPTSRSSARPSSPACYAACGPASPGSSRPMRHLGGRLSQTYPEDP
ncbi:MAG: alpha/beta fold hydrolase [Chloroflexi bacterium]|nr:MAG: alpha/beta fold hydrolase [Chloroflexota bacterium]